MIQSDNNSKDVQGSVTLPSDCRPTEDFAGDDSASPLKDKVAVLHKALITHCRILEEIELAL